MSDRRLRAFAPLIVFAILALTHFFFIARSALSIPYWDEWEMITGLGRVTEGGGWRWFFAPHNEHMIVLTKLQVWLSYLTSRWDVRSITLFNFALFLSIPVGFWALCVHRQKADRYAVFAFLIFSLSPINYENHSWSHQSCFHFSILLLGIAGWQLFKSPQTWRSLTIGSLAGGLAVLSLASSVTGSVAMLAIFTARKLLAMKKHPNARAAGTDVLQLVFVLAIYLAFIGFFWRNVLPTRGGTSLSLVFTLDYWIFFFRMFTFGFGIDGKATWLGPLFVGAFVYCIWNVRRRLLAEDALTWTLLAWAGAIVGAIGGTALGRVTMGTWLGRSSRYFEIVMLLPPILAVLWNYAAPNPRIRQRVLIAGWVGLFCAFFDNWNFTVYRETETARAVAEACVGKALIEKTTPAVCKTAYPNPIDAYLVTAQRLNLRFLKAAEASARAN